jgi:phage protein D
MANTYRLLLDGVAADEDLYSTLTSLEVEENVDLPGAIQLNLPVSRSDTDDLIFVNDARFKPFANLAVVATPEGQGEQCIFDGYVLAHRLHLQTGTTDSSLQVWGQDAAWLMNLEEKAREWVNMTDAAVAATIFRDYSITPAPENSEDDSPAHTEDGHSLMQRESDIQFLQSLARRNGKLCRIACADTPGQRTGYFAKPKLDGEPALSLKLNDPEGAWIVEALDFEWDVTRPSAVKARQALFNDSDPDGVGADTEDAGLALLDERGLAAFAGRPMTVLLAAPVDDAGELTLRAQSVLRESGWFVRCQGEVDAARLNGILRAGTLVQIEAAGSLFSGKYFVWSVRHTITAEMHTMKFTFARNALGPEPGAAGGLLGGLL